MSSVAELIAAAGLTADATVKESVPGVTWHVTKPLAQDGIETIGQLAARSDADLLEVPGFGERRLTALKAALAELAQ